MLNDKQIKTKFRPLFAKNPDKYYATNILKEDGFTRHICKKCKKPFWTVVPDQECCGDPACTGGFDFFGNSPAKHKMDYVQTWQKFAKLFSKWGYEPIKRYPVVARWRDDMEYVMASICDFQPYVVSGEVKPPAKKLVVPQFCLRFNDIDNVGITGAHYTGFIMIGQHAFLPPEDWEQDQFFRDIHNWLKQGIGLPNEEVTFHEDVWAGGGNFGPCMEYFSRGLELGNQVYMTNEVTPSGVRDLNLKVLDMGMGHERNAWFTQGTSTSYESTFPTVVKKLYSATGLKVDNKLMMKFLPYSSFLNVDEVDDINKVWKDVAKKIGMKVDKLKENILPPAALYSIGEHARSLLFAIADGGLPSNVGGGYNLRIILRRALSFIDQYGWDIYLPDVCKWHAKYLKPLFPELSQNLDIVEEVLEVEKQKYETTKQKSESIVKNIIKKDITTKKLVDLYDSQGISPEIIKEQAAKMGRKVDVPADFFILVSEKHAKKEQVHETRKQIQLDLKGVDDTEALYFDNYLKLTSKAAVVKVIGKYIILDKTIFYPTSGGQLHDVGTIDGHDVVDVFKQGSVIVHMMASEKEAKMFNKGDKVTLKILKSRRVQLAQHHTATHIVNAAAKRVLGNHVNQAGAKKTLEKAHLDVTHFKSITPEEQDAIEAEANKIIKSKVNIHKAFYSRDEAESKFGMGIYQGGAVPGKKLRIVDVPQVDVEACGGTHLDNTSEIGSIKILKTTKVQDGICRIVFVAGKAADSEEGKEKGIMDEAGKLLGVDTSLVPKRAEELFKKWKKGGKLLRKIGMPGFADKVKSGDIEVDLDLKSTDKTKGDLVAETAKILKTQPEHILKTLKRFMGELKEAKKKIEDKLK